ncbi:MAG: DUF86 domain-containing protein [Pyrinomonadaceae bacterium]
MALSIEDYLRHIFDETRFLSTEVSAMDEISFLQNETAKRAFVRSLEVIGEAVKQIPDDVRSKYPEIQWKSIAGMRDKLIHEYFGVDHDIVWDAATNKTPELEATVTRMLKDMYGE